MAKFECTVCGNIIEASEKWKDISEEWKCPICESDKSYYKLIEEKPVMKSLVSYKCDVCDTIHEGPGNWKEITDEWKCPVCESSKSYFKPVSDRIKISNTITQSKDIDIQPSQKLKIEEYFDDIKKISETGESIIEPMRTNKPTISWDDILIKGTQLAKIPLNKDEFVNTKTIIGPKAKKPLEIEMPIYITHMSFGALSKEIKIALARGSAKVKIAMCSGEGGILIESFENSYKYIFEYVPNLYSVTDENLKKVDAIEIKIGQSTKPGMGGHLPGGKVTKEIATIRGFSEGEDIISPSHFQDITTKEELKSKVDWLREKSEGKPIGIKIAAGNIEDDMEFAVYSDPDFITIDGRPGATGASNKFVKNSTSVPTISALYRARKYLDEQGINDISLIITGGLRISSDFVKAFALGADAVAIGTSALIACGCDQYRICNTGKCPKGITTQDENRRKRINIDDSAKKLENFLKVTKKELVEFARLTGNNDIHNISIMDLCTTNSEISNHTNIKHIFDK